MVTKFLLKLSFGLCLVSWLVGTPDLLKAQEGDYGVLEMKQGIHDAHLNTGVDLHNEIRNGATGEATIEFWLESKPTNAFELCDMHGGDDFFSMKLQPNGTFIIHSISSTQEVNLSEDLNSGSWNHWAFAFNNTNENNCIMSLFINGQLLSEFELGMIFHQTQNRNLYLKKERTHAVKLAEFRVWNDLRTPLEINRYWLRSFVKASDAKWESYKANGLSVFYGKNSSQEISSIVLPDLQSRVWTNSASDEETVGARFVNQLGDEVISSVFNDEEHPILNNQIIYVDASKGQFENKIQLKWQHVKGVDYYSIYRIAPDRQDVATLNDLTGINVSDELSVTDETGIIPGVLYTYVVEGRKMGNSAFSTAGQDNGFIFFNGRISGTIKTPGDLFVKDVAVEAKVANGHLPGSALSFQEDDTPILFSDVSDLRRKNNFDFEFWYKASSNNNSFNKVIEIGDLQLLLKHDAVKLKEGSHSLLNTAIETSNEWRHYSFNIGSEHTNFLLNGTKIAEGEAFGGFPGNIKRMILGADIQSSFSIDEMRIWNKLRTEEEVAADYRYLQSGNEENLCLYYRMDMGTSYYVYNQSEMNKGYRHGEWDHEVNNTPNWLSNEECTTELVYGSYSNAGGNYSMMGINYGTDPDGLQLKIEPIKQYHVFGPESRFETFRRSQDIADYQKRDIDFRDESVMEVAGRLYYHDENDPEDAIYPVPAGQKFVVSGSVQFGEDATSSLTGSYCIEAPLGVQTIAVNNPVLTNQLGFASLSFDGEDDYAQSDRVYNMEAASISGWLFLGDSEEEMQCIWSMGDSRLILRNNQRLVLFDGEEELLESRFALTANAWNFFSLNYEPEEERINLYVNDAKVERLDTELSFTGQMTYGGEMIEGVPSNLYKGKLDDLFIYDTYLSEGDTEKVMGGNILTDQADHLIGKYHFEEEKGVRTISWTPNGQDYMINLYGDMKYDNQLFHPYLYEYDFDYRAVNDRYAINEDGKSYRPNVLTPITEVDFENKTRFGIVGNIIVPCGCSVGEWTGEIIRVDVAEGKRYPLTADHFNDDFTAFCIDGLMPGEYEVRLAKADDPTVTNDPLTVDIRAGWNIYNFEFENPLIIEATFIRKAIFTPMETWEFEEVATTCEDEYVLDKISYYDLQIKAYQRYTSGDCMISDFEYTIGDNDLGIAAPKTPQDEAGTYVMPPSGIDTVRILTKDPNFIAPYTRRLSIATTAGGGIVKDLDAYIVGVKQFNQDFTIEPPEEMIMVLHDPPGDNSSVSWHKGNTANFTTNWSIDGGTNLTFDVSTGVDMDSYQGQWFGVGGGIMMMQRMIWSQASSKFNTSHVIGAGYQGSQMYSVNLDQTISTDGGGSITGSDADVFVGVSSVVTMGLGKSLKIEGCEPVLEELHVAVPQAKSMFVHNHQHIVDRIIPNWEILRDQAIEREHQDSIDICNGKIDKWWQILDANKDKIDNIENFSDMILSNNEAGSQELENSFNFSAGSVTSWTIGTSESTSHGFTQNYSGDISTDFDFKFNAFGADVNLKTGVKVFWNENFSLNDSNETSESFTVNLGDDDDGDQFDVLMRKDPDFGCPIFRTRSGSSMCPYEHGTQPREGVELVAESYTTFAQPGDPAVFKLKMRNIQVADDNTTKHYVLVPLNEHYPPGAVVKINGGPFNAPKQYDLDPQEESESIVITVAQGPGIENEECFENLPFVAVSACELSGDSYVYSYDEFVESGVQVVDTVYLTANYHRNCVESIEMLTPQDDWFVNGDSNDELLFKFKLNEPLNTLTKVLVEIAVDGSNEGSILQEITAEELETLIADDHYITLNVRIGRPDGRYKLRLVPMCGIGGETWRRMTPTEWVTGNLQRVAPLITHVEPQNNGILASGGVIRAFLDHPILDQQVNDMNVIMRGALPGSQYVPNSVIFNHSDDYISAPDEDHLNFDGAYSVEFWIYPDAYPAEEVPLVSKGENINITLFPDGKIYNGKDLSTSLIPGRWTHVAVVYNGANDCRTFFDGEPVCVNMSSGGFNVSDEDLYIAKPTASGNSFRGRLDEFRLWSRARNVAEILTDRIGTLKGDEAGLEFYMPMDNVAPLGIGGLQEIIGKSSTYEVNGISFTTEVNQAAPIEKDLVRENIPIEVSLTNGNEVMITPIMGMDKLEGAELIVRISDDKLQDAYSNKVEGKTWFFRVDQNAVSWNKANVLMDQAQGEVSQFEETLTNHGSSRITYEIIDLPAWINLRNSHDLNGELLSGYEYAIGFEIAPWLNPGVHKANIKAKTRIYNPLDGTLLPGGIETFELQVNVGCTKPTYNINPIDFIFEMNITAELFIQGELSQDEDDVVAIFVEDELRGYGSPRYLSNKDKWIVQIQLFSNSTSAEENPFTFRVWDASACKEYIGIVESYEFASNALIGNTSNPVSITTAGKEAKTYQLNAGNHYLSFSLQKDEDNAVVELSQLKGFSHGDFIMNSNGQQAVFSNGSFNGDLVAMSPYESYLVHVKENTKLELQGYPSDIDHDIIVFNSRINWIGYNPETMMRLHEALRSVMASTISENDRITCKYGMAEYVDGEWFGSLEHMTPGLGYKLYVQEVGILNYVGISQANREYAGVVPSARNLKKSQRRNTKDYEYVSKSARDRGLVVAPEKYLKECHYIAKINKSNMALDKPMLLVAYRNDSLVGVGVPKDVMGEVKYYFTIYGGNEEAALQFEIIDLETNRRFEASEEAVYAPEKFFGSSQFPYEINIGAELITSEQGAELYQNSPNPFHDRTSISYFIKEPSFVKLYVTTSSGNRLFGLNYEELPAGSYDINLRNQGRTRMEPGIYFYTLETKFGRITKKMIVH